MKTSVWRAVAAVWACATIPTLAHQSQAQSGRADAAISGVVRDAVTARPIAGAVVSLNSAGRRPFDPLESRATDPKGRFVFVNLARNTYTLHVQRLGYFDGVFGQRDSRVERTSTIALADGEWFANADVLMWKPAGISGTVADEAGEPVMGAYVRALAQIQVAGNTWFAAGPLAVTDDRGSYRVGDLPVGRYTVMVLSSTTTLPADVSVGNRAQQDIPSIMVGATTRALAGRYPTPAVRPDGRSRIYPIAFAGGAATIARAPTFDLEPGLEHAGTNIQLVAMPAWRISGMVQGPVDGLANLTLRLLPEGLEDLGLGSEAGTALVGQDGRFVFADVPDGMYTIDSPLSVNEYSVADPAVSMFYGLSPPPALVPATGGLSRFGGPATAATPGTNFWAGALSATRYWARTKVVVSGHDETGVTVTLQHPATMSGRIVVESDARFPVPDRAPTLSQLETASGRPWLGQPRAVSNRDTPESFLFDKIVPGQYFLRTSMLSGWLIKSVVHDGRDLTQVPIDLSSGASISGVVVTFTNALPELSGGVRGAPGASAADAEVIVFPVNREQWTDYGIAPARIRTTAASNAGTFTFTALPAGDYYVIALPSAAAERWRDPEFFIRAARTAARVTIAWGEKKTADAPWMDVR